MKLPTTVAGAMALLNEGYLGMPAKGGNARLSEYDVDAAVEYMLTITHPELPRD